MSAEKSYYSRASSLKEKDFVAISNFYQNWAGQTEVDIKFRFIKLFGYDRQNNSAGWYNLHHLLNIRRFKTDNLPRYMEDVLEMGIYPLRIFHSCTEWLAPNEVGLSETARIIRSGILPLENDTNLPVSLQVARSLDQIIDSPKFVFSGNKSIHIWIDVEFNYYDTKTLAHADRREEAETAMRRREFNNIKKQIDQPLDRRISTDPRRVVPIINSLNAITMQRVIQLESNNIGEISVDKIIQLSAIRS